MKRIKIVSIIIILAFLAAIPVFNVAEADEVLVTPNKLVVFKFGDYNYYTQDIGSDVVNKVRMDAAPIITQDRTFIPVRFLANALGVTDNKIEWNQANQTVTMQGRCELKLKIGEKAFYSDGKKANIDVAPHIIEPSGRTVLPARYVAEGLGYKVEWESNKQLVICYPKDKEKLDMDKMLEKIEEKDKNVKKVTIDCRNITSWTEIDKYPEFIIYPATRAVEIISIDERKYRFVCTSHEILNSQYYMTFGDTTFTKHGPHRIDDSYVDQYDLKNLFYLKEEIKSGMTIKCDIYNQSEVKIYEMTFQM